MKLPLIIGAIIIVIAGGIFFSMNSNKSNVEQNTVTRETEAVDTPAESPKTTTLKLMAQKVGSKADCSLYNFDELSKIWGVPFTDTDINNVSQLSTAGGLLYSCSYNQTDSGKGVTFTIDYREHLDVESAKRSINDTKSTEKYGDVVYYKKEDVSGIGDEAFLWSKNRTDKGKDMNQQLYVRKDNVVFLLSGVNIDGVSADYKDKLIQSYKLHFK